MTTVGSSAMALPPPCSCKPDPESLPVALLTATVDDPTIRPTLLTLTVDYEASVWRAQALARHILEWVADFALRRDERDNVPAGRLVERCRRAVNATFGNGQDRGVPGEILLHAVCRQFFGSDTVISKVWFKTAKNDTYKGFDIVHCVHDEEEMQLWLGEAKFYTDLSQAIKAALTDLNDHFDTDYLRDEFGMIVPKIDDSHPHAQELRSLMHPNTSLDKIFHRIVVPVLVAYESATTKAHNSDCQTYRSELEAEVRRAWMKFAEGVPTTLPVSVRLLLVPMASKKELLTAIERELLPWR